MSKKIRGLSSVLGSALISAVASQAIPTLSPEMRIVVTMLAVVLVVAATHHDTTNT